jgi:hypothetical protein
MATGPLSSHRSVHALAAGIERALNQARAGFDRGHALYGQTVMRRLDARREAVGATRLQGGVWARDNAHGAKLELYGLAVGTDAWATESWLIGASLNMLKLDADFRAGRQLRHRAALALVAAAGSPARAPTMPR